VTSTEGQRKQSPHKKLKVAEIKGKTWRYIITLRDTLSHLVKTEEDKEKLGEEFKKLIEILDKEYRLIVNPSIIWRDKKWILARYWDKREKREYSVEVFKNKFPTKEGLQDYRGYVVLEEGGIEKGSTVCRDMGIEWGDNSAPRYLWNYLNKIADEKGVEEPEVTYESL